MASLSMLRVGKSGSGTSKATLEATVVVGEGGREAPEGGEVLLLLGATGEVGEVCEAVLEGVEAERLLEEDMVGGGGDDGDGGDGSGG